MDRQGTAAPRTSKYTFIHILKLRTEVKCAKKVTATKIELTQFRGKLENLFTRILRY